MTVLSIYRLFRTRSVGVLALAALLLAFVSDAGGEEIEYPVAFKARAQAVTAVPGAGAHPTVDRYVQFVNSMQDDPNWRVVMATLYAEELYYSDTFFIANSRADVERHFASLHDGGNEITLEVFDVMQGAQGTYLVWSATNRFSLLGSSVSANSIGITLFQFDREGRITLQQDFWDSAQGFYQHIPVVGGVVQAIRRRVASG